MATIKHWRRYLNQHFLDNPIVSQVFSPTFIEKLCQQAGHRWRDTFWSPSITMITFVLQILSAEKTLRAAVASLLAQLSAQGERLLPSADPTAYCQARIRLPVQVIEGIMGHVVEGIRELIKKEVRVQPFAIDESQAGKMLK